MSTPAKTPTQKSEISVIHYMGLAICGGLSAIGIYQIFTNRVQDGIINIIIGSSLIFSFIPFDYNKAKNWQKGVLIAYAIGILFGTGYVIYKGFVK
jgi:hypothetical protein